ncbi:hypothetical protein Tsubulata_027642, partial [Turnera subulata]
KNVGGQLGAAQVRNISTTRTYTLTDKTKTNALCLRVDPRACLLKPIGQSNSVDTASDDESLGIQLELSELLLNLRPIRQVARFDFGAILCWGNFID